MAATCTVRYIKLLKIHRQKRTELRWRFRLETYIQFISHRRSWGFNLLKRSCTTSFCCGMASKRKVLPVCSEMGSECQQMSLLRQGICSARAFISRILFLKQLSRAWRAQRSRKTEASSSCLRSHLVTCTRHMHLTNSKEAHQCTATQYTALVSKDQSRVASKTSASLPLASFQTN